MLLRAQSTNSHADNEDPDPSAFIVALDSTFFFISPPQSRQSLTSRATTIHTALRKWAGRFGNSVFSHIRDCKVDFRYLDFAYLESQITYSSVKCDCLIYFFPTLCKSDMSVEERISRSISERPLDFEITRVDCIFIMRYE